MPMKDPTRIEVQGCVHARACVEDMETKPFPGFYFSMWSFGVNIIIDSQSQGL